LSDFLICKQFERLATIVRAFKFRGNALDAYGQWVSKRRRYESRTGLEFSPRDEQIRYHLLISLPLQSELAIGPIG
jgi:hypothetical protein